MAIRPRPIASIGSVPETKYGNAISDRPQTSGTMAFCFLPYQKKPKPIEPKIRP